MIGNGQIRPGHRTPVWVYHPLPDFLPVMLNRLVILDWSTKVYQPRDLGRGRPQDTFTNTYHLAMRTDYRLL